MHVADLVLSNTETATEFSDYITLNRMLYSVLYCVVTYCIAYGTVLSHAVQCMVLCCHMLYSVWYCVVI